MKTPVMDGVYWAAKGYVTKELEALTQKESADFENLEKLLLPYDLDYNMTNKLFDAVTAISSDSEQRGFQNGFRLAVRLMLESMGAPGEPETGGGA
nr:DUF6809 family protein [uncultured Oscillibacter sp.]